MDELQAALAKAQQRVAAKGSNTDQTERTKPYRATFPEPIELSSIWGEPVQLAPELIKGVLREKHKLILTAPSKAGKTVAMIELCFAVASGGQWLGFDCKQGRCYYLNLELDANSCHARFQKVGEKLRIKKADTKNISISDLRGDIIPFSELAPQIADRVQHEGFDLVIIDPVYKLFTGSENDQEAVTAFCNNIDLIAEAGASVVYCHHHSKGKQGYKSSMDRGSGSGVFARDADAILDLIEVENSVGITGWRLEGVLREFPPFQVKHFFFNFPLHVLDSTGILKGAPEKGALKSGGQLKMEKRDRDTERFLKAYADLSADGKPVHIKEIAGIIDKSDKTIRRYALDNGFTVSRGILTKSVQ